LGNRSLHKRIVVVVVLVVVLEFPGVEDEDDAEDEDDPLSIGTEFAMNERPNIVLIMTDQQRGDCLSAEGHPVLLTPNMDNIGFQGARFRRAYSTCPVCIPARRSLLSGQFPHTHGMVGYRDRVEWDATVTLPGALAAAGYQTALIGRSMHQWPPRKRYGYEQMVVYDHLCPEDYDEFLRRHAPVGNAGWLSGGVFHNDWTARPWHLAEPLHMTNWIVDEALKFLARRDPSCPFFLTVSFLAPHPPLQPPAFYLERYLRTGVPEPVVGDWAEKPETPGEFAVPDAASSRRVQLEGEALRSCRAAYYGLINHVDDQMRRLLEPLAGLPQVTGGNLVLVFTSDHGEMLGDHYLWRKQQPYESSARVPLLIRVPHRLGWPRGVVLDPPVCLEDIMPTLLELADVEIPSTVEGRSLVPLLRGEKPAWRDCLHLECAPHFHALTDGHEKYVWLPASGAEQFFDLRKDPNELRNLAGKPSHRARIARWRRRLIAELEDRPEGFTDGRTLTAGRPYPAVMPHGAKRDRP
jgi:arylsulfatase